MPTVCGSLREAIARTICHETRQSAAVMADAAILTSPGPGGLL